MGFRGSEVRILSLRPKSPGQIKTVGIVAEIFGDVVCVNPETIADCEQVSCRDFAIEFCSPNCNVCRLSRRSVKLSTDRGDWSVDGSTARGACYPIVHTSSAETQIAKVAAEFVTHRGARLSGPAAYRRVLGEFARCNNELY